MRAVVQRVSSAGVSVGGQEISSIGRGLLVLLGVGKEDGTEDVEWLARKLAQLRIFEDAAGERMDRSVVDIDGEVLVVSQFTLHARVKKGTRPSFEKAAAPDLAIPLYESFVETMAQHLGKPVPTGKFGAMMDVQLVNDGPVTIVIDTKNRE